MKIKITNLFLLIMFILKIYLGLKDNFSPENGNEYLDYAIDFSFVISLSISFYIRVEEKRMKNFSALVVVMCFVQFIAHLLSTDNTDNRFTRSPIGLCLFCFIMIFMTFYEDLKNFIKNKVKV